MQKIKFNNDETLIYDVYLNIIKSEDNRTHLSCLFVNTIPDENIVNNGFIEINENNMIQQSDFSDFKYIYKINSDYEYVFTDADGDIYEEPIPEPAPEPVPTPPYITTEEELQANFEKLKLDKISELSIMCQNVIYSGADVDNKHYSYTLQDQVNLINAINTAQSTNMDVAYHADGESFCPHSLKQLQNIYTFEQINVARNQIYFNQFKEYIESFMDREDSEIVRTFFYGYELGGIYYDSYNQIFEQTKLVLQTMFLDV